MLIGHDTVKNSHSCADVGRRTAKISSARDKLLFLTFHHLKQVCSILKYQKGEKGGGGGGSILAHLKCMIVPWPPAKCGMQVGQFKGAVVRTTTRFEV